MSKTNFRTDGLWYRLFPRLRATRHVPGSLFPLPRATCYVPYALFLLSVGCATVEPQPGQDVLAYVNGEPVTVEVVEASFSESHQGHSAFLAGQGVVRQLLDKVIDKRLLVQEARRLGFDHDSKVEQAVQRLRDTRASESFYRDTVTDRVTISDQDLAEAYKRAGARFQARHILVESREAVENALRRIKNGADFAEVAVEISQANTAAKGGYLGVIRFGQLEPELEDVLWPLQTGQVSEPFETSDGWNLVYVGERTSIDPPPLDKIEAQLRAILHKREARRLQQVLYQELQTQWRPQIEQATLQAIVSAPAKSALKDDAAIVVIGDERITTSRILPRIDFEKLKKLPGPTAVRAVRNTLEPDIFGILIRKEALARGYAQRPEIEKEGETLRDKLVLELLFDRVAFAKLEASDAEAEEYWRKYPQAFTEPEAVKVGVIFMSSERDADRLLADLQGGADFSIAARKYSEHKASAELGGDMGWINKGRLQPEIEKVAFALKPGELGIARIDAGFMIVRVEARKSERLKSFAEAKEQAKDLALQEKARATLRLWVMKLREASIIEIDERAITRAAAAFEEKVRQKAEPKHG